MPATWTFVAISDELDEFARRKATQRDRPKGKVFDDAEFNITVWVKEWAEVINDARARLGFVNKQLAYEADRDTAKTYLRKTHAKFIPNPDAMDKEAGNEESGQQAGPTS